MLNVTLAFADRNKKAEPIVLYAGRDGVKALEAFDTAPKEAKVVRLYKLSEHYKQVDLEAKRASESPSRKEDPPEPVEPAPAKKKTASKK